MHYPKFEQQNTFLRNRPTMCQRIIAKGIFAFLGTRIMKSGVCDAPHAERAASLRRERNDMPDYRSAWTQNSRAIDDDAPSLGASRLCYRYYRTR